MELSQIIPHVEALIFASDKPLINIELVELLNNALGFIENRATIEQVDAAIEGIYEKYNAEFYAFELKHSGGGWQFLTKREYHKTVAQLNGDKFLKRLSTAALETLAIIAYKQPIAKSEMEAIRGVNCDYAVQKLLEKDLVIIAGRNEDAVGKPLIYTTSKSFMDYFGINSTADLPKINEVLMEELVQATIVNNQPISIEREEEPAIISEKEEESPLIIVTEEAGQELSGGAKLYIQADTNKKAEKEGIVIETIVAGENEPNEIAVNVVDNDDIAEEENEQALEIEMRADELETYGDEFLEQKNINELSKQEDKKDEESAS